MNIQNPSCFWSHSFLNYFNSQFKSGVHPGTKSGISPYIPKNWNICLLKSAESERCPSFYNSMLKGEPTYTPCDSTLADGLAVSMVGVNSFATAKPLVDKSVQVSEEYIAIAILRLLELEKAVVEGNSKF